MSPGWVGEADVSSQVVRTPSEVWSAYENLLEAFRGAAEAANLQVKFPERPVASCFTESGKGTTVAFKRSLYVKGCPCGKLSRGERLDIVIMALEDIAKGSWLLKKSTVYLNYFAVSNSEAHLVQALHYDFEEGGQPGHPFFHVQLTDEPIAEGDLRSTGFDLELKLQEQSKQCCVTTRIPTPDMTLASVLYCLVADHLKGGIFSEFAERVHSIQNRLPGPCFDALKKSLQEPLVHFKSSHWFAHMREPTQQGR
jgi:hypothetical protein